MTIAKNKVVTIDYTLTDNSGDVIDRSVDGGFSYLHGAENIIPGLEQLLAGKSVGESLTVTIPPEEAYGLRDDALTQVVPKEAFDTQDEIEVGQQFHAQSPDDKPMVITVVAVEDTQITIDGNHPLAGVELNFDVKIIDIRDASEDEISHGHTHGADAHADHDA